MDEAEYLADSIGVMSRGSLLASGTSIALRNRFGNGYKLTLITKPHSSSQMKALVESKFPEALLVTSNAGSLSYTVPQSSLGRMSHFFQHIQESPNARGLLQDWGLLHSSKPGVIIQSIFKLTGREALEEVFHNITQLSEEDSCLLQSGELLQLEEEEDALELD